ncbi:MAG: hypothetical protein JXA21_22080 [Anaerolineae bacterium]|nr:hypothetical protein [Anaerolineae bacterium]
MKLLDGIFALFLFLIPIGMVWVAIDFYRRRIPALDGFTDGEKVTLRRQAIVMGLNGLFLGLFFLSITITMEWLRIVGGILLLGIGLPLGLGYIGLTSIIGRVCLFGSLRANPSRGMLAVIQGAVALGGSLIITAVFIGWVL